MNLQLLERTCSHAAMAADYLDTREQHFEAAVIRALVAHLQDAIEELAPEGEPALPEPGEPARPLDAAPAKPPAKKRGRPAKTASTNGTHGESIPTSGAADGGGAPAADGTASTPAPELSLLPREGEVPQ